MKYPRLHSFLISLSLIEVVVSLIAFFAVVVHFETEAPTTTTMVRGALICFLLITFLILSFASSKHPKLAYILVSKILLYLYIIAIWAVPSYISLFDLTNQPKSFGYILFVTTLTSIPVVYFILHSSILVKILIQTIKIDQISKIK
jgi:hypothetical protein